MEKIGLVTFEEIDALTPKAMRNVEWVRIELQVRHTIGRELSSVDLYQRRRLSGPEVRAIIHYLRTDHCPIGSNSKGYFWATRPEDLETTRKHLTQRANSMYEVARILSSIMQDMRSGRKANPQKSIFDKSEKVY